MTRSPLSPFVVLFVVWLTFVFVSLFGLLQYEQVLGNEAIFDLTLSVAIIFSISVATKILVRKDIPSIIDDRIPRVEKFLWITCLLGLFGSLVFSFAVVSSVGIGSFTDLGTARDAILFSSRSTGALHYVGQFLTPLSYVVVAYCATRARRLVLRERIYAGISAVSLLLISLVQVGRVNFIVLLMICAVRVIYLYNLKKVARLTIALIALLGAACVVLVFIFGFARFATGTTEDYYRTQFNAEKRYPTGALGGGAMENFSLYACAYFGHSIPNYSWMREVDLPLPLAKGGMQLSLIGRRLSSLGIPDSQDVSLILKATIISNGRLPNTWYTALRDYRLDFGQFWWVWIIIFATIASVSHRCFDRHEIFRQLYIWIVVIFVFSPMFSLLNDTFVQLWFIYAVVFSIVVNRIRRTVKQPFSPKVRK